MEIAPPAYLFFAFSVMMLIFAGLIVLSRVFADMVMWKAHTPKKHTKKFRVNIAKHLCICAIGPAIGGLAGFTGSEGICVMVFFIATIVFIVLSFILLKDPNMPDEDDEQ